MKKIITVMIMVLLIGGCSITDDKNTKKYTRAEVKQLMIAYAEKKYGKKFQAIGDVGHVNFSSSSPFDMYLCEVGKYDEEEDNLMSQAYDFYMKLEIDDNELIFSDNYAGIYYRDVAKKEIDKLVGDKVNDEIINVRLVSSDCENPKFPLTLKEAFNNQLISNSVGVLITIFLDESQYNIESIKSSYVDIINVLKKEYQTGSLSIQILDSETYNQLKDKDVNKFFQKEYTKEEKYEESFYIENKIKERWGEPK